MPNPRPAVQLFTALREARRLEMRARWREQNVGWREGRGTGSVAVSMEGRGRDARIHFLEEGVWRPEGGSPLRFRNRYRWTRSEDGVLLEHLRRGPGHPVFLVELQADEDGSWSSEAPHRCGADRYRARVCVEPGEIVLTWGVRGPEKSQRLVSTYR